MTIYLIGGNILTIWNLMKFNNRLIMVINDRNTYPSNFISYNNIIYVMIL
jgi:hypothetical protein